MQRHPDKRRRPRVLVELPVTFLIRGPDSRTIVTGVARDISIGGMFIETPLPADFGVALLVGITLPHHGEEMLLPATVRWRNARGMGVQFGLLGARETYAITEIGRTHSGVRESLVPGHGTSRDGR